MEVIKDQKYKAAKKRLEALKGFYNHLVVYIIINAIIIGINIFYVYKRAGEEVFENFWLWVSFNTFSTAIFWGIGLAFHAFKVFKFDFFKSWEDRKVQEFLEKEEARDRDLKF